jgi:hypothetical protein
MVSPLTGARIFFFHLPNPGFTPRAGAYPVGGKLSPLTWFSIILNMLSIPKTPFQGSFGARIITTKKTDLQTNGISISWSGLCYKTTFSVSLFSHCDFFYHRKIRLKKVLESKI